jgi:hypothetical protein
MADVPESINALVRDIIRTYGADWNDGDRESVAEMINAKFKVADDLVENLERFLKDTRVEIGGTRQSLQRQIDFYRCGRPA